MSQHFRNLGCKRQIISALMQIGPEEATLLSSFVGKPGTENISIIRRQRFPTETRTGTNYCISNNMCTVLR